MFNAATAVSKLRSLLFLYRLVLSLFIVKVTCLLGWHRNAQNGFRPSATKKNCAEHRAPTTLKNQDLELVQIPLYRVHPAVILLS